MLSRMSALDMCNNYWPYVLHFAHLLPPFYAILSPGNNDNQNMNMPIHV